MSRIIAYDMCRLFIGPYFATPRGIDRVDLAVANHVFADPDSPHVAILPTPLGVRAYPARTARLLLDHLHAAWGERAGTENDMRLHRLIAGINSPAASGEFPPLGIARRTRADSVLRSLNMLRHTGLRLGGAASTTVPADAAYVNLGQLALAMPRFFTWLKKRQDIACVMMIHDTIPLDHPEMVKPTSVAHHARMIETAAAHADGLIFSTAFAQSSVNLELAKLRARPVCSLVRALPVPAAFVAAGERLPELANTRYFVAVSTIEPRKNFGLLLNIWRKLVDRMGSEAPHLVIVGAYGLDAENILAPLAGSPQLRARVHWVSGLSTPALARLMLGCAAVLSPSHAEGFGLPLLEGIATGVPTIASDIPSHREIAHETTTLLNAADEASWEAAILAVAGGTNRRRRRVPVEMTEAAYCADVLAFLDSVQAKGRASAIEQVP